MKSIQPHVQATLQDIYRKAVDADQKLDSLQQKQQGKFQAIFDKDAGFSIQAKRFLPYVEALTQEWNSIQEQNETEQHALLPVFVNKLELMLRTLANFRAI